MREQGARSSKCCLRIASRRGHHFLWAGPGPPTSYIEHPRLMCISRESDPGPPALQANTLFNEPLNGITKYYSEPQLVLLHCPFFLVHYGFTITTASPLPAAGVLSTV